MKESSSRSSNRAVLVMLVGLMATIGCAILVLAFWSRGTMRDLRRALSCAIDNSSRAEGWI